MDDMLKLTESIKLGQAIRSYREDSKVSINEFAELIKIDSAYLTQIEKHGKLPAPDVMSRVIDGLKINDSGKAALMSAYLRIKYPELAATINTIIADDSKRKLMENWHKWQEKESPKKSWQLASIPDRVLDFEKKNK